MRILVGSDTPALRWLAYIFELRCDVSLRSGNSHSDDTPHSSRDNFKCPAGEKAESR